MTPPLGRPPGRQSARAELEAARPSPSPNPAAGGEPAAAAALAAGVGRRHGLPVGGSDPVLLPHVHVPLFWHRPLPGVGDGAEAAARWVRGPTRSGFPAGMAEDRDARIPGGPPLSPDHPSLTSSYGNDTDPWTERLRWDLAPSSRVKPHEWVALRFLSLVTRYR